MGSGERPEGGERVIFSTEFRVPWVDTDAAGVVHFSNYFRYCERAEEEFLESLGLSYTDQGWGDRDIWYPRVHAGCDYKYPLWYGDRARVEIVGVRVGRKSIEYQYRIANVTRGRVSAECRVVVVSASKSRGRAVELPKPLLRALEERGLAPRGPREGEGK